MGQRDRVRERERERERKRKVAACGFNVGRRVCGATPKDYLSLVNDITEYSS